MAKIMALMGALASLVGCTTPTQEGATCSAQWDTYADDRMHGAMLGGSLSGNKPTCSFDQRPVAAQ
jgi:hypothetical protein